MTVAHAKRTLGSIQEAFYAAVRQSQETAAHLRLTRKALQPVGAGEGTRYAPSAEFGVAEHHSKQARYRSKTPTLRISTGGGTSEFQATKQLIRRLARISEDQGEIICLGRPQPNGPPKGFSCKGLQSFWTREGRTPPELCYTDASLYDVLETNPLAVFMDPAKAPGRVSGYLRVCLTDPRVCLFLREQVQA